MVGVVSWPIVWSSTDGKWAGAYMSFFGKQEGNDIVKLLRSQRIYSFRTYNSALVNKDVFDLSSQPAP